MKEATSGLNYSYYYCSNTSINIVCNITANNGTYKILAISLAQLLLTVVPLITTPFISLNTTNVTTRTTINIFTTINKTKNHN